ncbi:PorP/SprF family type IX secretion system membrane protein [Crocinitomix catalasitica]|uniref:PorP/SprF family type IX secretion system membrane protein n=1 Tax=Crocinitomix catalasitica TaxID=184607 RepID=UPI000B155F1E|nr:type IX secretion system membrane protein PorP/SprF [Crocinitomix catalasitica]
MRKIILFFIVSLSFSSFAQYDALYTQYVYNPLVINPAYAGSRNSLSSVLSHRTGWTGIEDTPSTQTVSVHSKFKHNNLAWGFNLNNDKLGATSNLFAGFTAGYHLQFKNSKLSIAMRAGVFNSKVDGSKFTFRNPTDYLNLGASQSSLVPNFDFGLYYYAPNYYLGLTVNHFVGQKLRYNKLGGVVMEIEPLLMLSGGYVFEINNKLSLKPTFLLKKTAEFEANLDIGLNAFLFKKVWFGINVRNKSALNFLLDVNITDFMRIGYSYDFFLNKISSSSNGVHEIFVGFELKTKKDNSVNPRSL